MGLPCGTASRSYGQDMAIVRTRVQWGLLAALFVLMVAAPFFLNTYLLSIANIIAIWIIAAYGLNILTGYCGQISLGHSAFMGVGAYTAAILATKLGVSFWVAVPCAVLTTGLVGILFGLPSVRIKGFYLAMATLAAQFILAFVFLHWKGMTGGYQGMPAPRPQLGGLIFDTEQSLYYLIMGFAILATFAAKNLARTRVGRAFVAIRDNDLAAEVMGVNLFRYKLLAFFIASCFAGLGGSLWAFYAGHVSPDEWTLIASIWFLGMIIIGGLGSTMGTIFGVAFIKLLEQATSYFSPVLAGAFPALGGGVIASAGAILFAIIVILFLIFEPRGIAHRWELSKLYYRLWPFTY